VLVRVTLHTSNTAPSAADHISKKRIITELFIKLRRDNLNPCASRFLRDRYRPCRQNSEYTLLHPAGGFAARHVTDPTPLRRRFASDIVASKGKLTAPPFIVHLASTR
jgi:hypothetical protein